MLLPSLMGSSPSPRMPTVTMPFMGTHIADSLPPELLQYWRIGLVIPGAFAVALPLLLGAQHGLVVRGAHYNAVLVGQYGLSLSSSLKALPHMAGHR